MLVPVRNDATNFRTICQIGSEIADCSEPNENEEIS